ncbi:MAG TPA: L-ribulose-5-phosphate 4-epimerase [Gemmatimonadaceae bacterium]|jgi:L-ribulose-5-phosphate 4-epimerase|nr:L-ribulose-5-phosphate 4-epimerase [Gemmatimonadaceae bacterium]
MLATLRDEVLRANLELSRRGLALFTFGNASAIARNEGLVVIKPSGVPYDRMRAEDLVITDLDGQIVEGTMRPSSDLPTHLVLYRAFPALGGVVHTHSHYATVWAQAGREIPCMGTTHADYFHGPVPITEPMTSEEIASRYEENTGHAIVRRFCELDPMAMSAVLVAGHASFCWGPTVTDAVETASLLETVARMAYDTAALNPQASPISSALLDKHFLRKHGKNAYYGQPKSV